ncbi:LuxR C-terminal-related transcriptional regulator [Streptomyces olivaceus]|uniref:response regulator transcription factor n=1 Tax=Streptomyces olivaceus TaxID=47716 RepID=UPI001CCDF245|nr:LuxR C-terminal-related transcriptional regulator [Streptomyces olivaceus]MBZ6256906.1 LuxR C-terminal-related transcriptional regulator [Streptomyces olivaceus]
MAADAEGTDTPTAPLGDEEARNGAAHTLTKSESEVLRHLAQGKSVGQIAKLLHKSISTISRQKSDAKHKLGLHTDVELFDYLRNADFTEA